MIPLTILIYCFSYLLIYACLIILIPIGQIAYQRLDGIMAEGRWYSVSEVAEHLGITSTTLYKWLQRKELPAHKIGRLWKFKLDEIDAWVKSDKGNSKLSQKENLDLKGSVIR